MERASGADRGQMAYGQRSVPCSFACLLASQTPQPHAIARTRPAPVSQERKLHDSRAVSHGRVPVHSFKGRAAWASPGSSSSSVPTAPGARPRLQLSHCAKAPAQPPPAGRHHARRPQLEAAVTSLSGCHSPWQHPSLAAHVRLIILHGPHHVAVKSTTHFLPAALASSTVLLKCSVSEITMTPCRESERGKCHKGERRGVRRAAGGVFLVCVGGGSTHTDVTAPQRRRKGAARLASKAGSFPPPRELRGLLLAKGCGGVAAGVLEGACRAYHAPLLLRTGCSCASARYICWLQTKAKTGGQHAS